MVLDIDHLLPAAYKEVVAEWSADPGGCHCAVLFRGDMRGHSDGTQVLLWHCASVWIICGYKN